jgi:hypothetical protein
MERPERWLQPVLLLWAQLCHFCKLDERVVELIEDEPQRLQMGGAAC